MAPNRRRATRCIVVGACCAASSLFAAAAVPGEAGAAACPSSPVVGGADLDAVFNRGRGHRQELLSGQGELIRGHLRDAAGSAVAGAVVCVEERVDADGWAYEPAGTAMTDADGEWFFKLAAGPSRQIRVAYRDRYSSLRARLNIRAHARPVLRVGALVTRPGQPIHFRGRIPGPLAGGRVVFLRGTVPGARRSFLVRHARSDAFGRIEATYAFSPVAAPTKFVFRWVVPVQGDYPYLLGESPPRFVRVRPLARDPTVRFASIGSPEKGGGPILSHMLQGTLEVQGR
jgi:hypothetical protein